MMFLLGARRKVGCLGKLPLAADFDLERRLGGGAEEALASWLRAIPKPEGGAGKVSAGGADDGWGFLLLAPRGREAIAGRLWPSTDSAGRFFPFAIYTMASAKALGGGLAGLFPALAAAGRALEDLVKAGSAQGAEAFRGAVRKARIDFEGAAGACGQDLTARAGALPLWPLLEELYPRRTEEQAGAAFARWWKFLKNFEGPGRPAVGIRLPFGARTGADLQAAFWSGWMARALGREAPAPLALLVPRGSAEPGLWLLYRDLLPQDGEVLFSGRESHEFIFDLTPAGQRPEAFPPADRALLDRLRALETAAGLWELKG